MTQTRFFRNICFFFKDSCFCSQTSSLAFKHLIETDVCSRIVFVHYVELSCRVENNFINASFCSGCNEGIKCDYKLLKRLFPSGKIQHQKTSLIFIPLILFSQSTGVIKMNIQMTNHVLLYIFRRQVTSPYTICF